MRPHRRGREDGYFALDDYDSIDGALAPGMSSYQLTEPPLPIDGEDKDEARNRWAALLARASQDRLEL